MDFEKLSSPEANYRYYVINVLRLFLLLLMNKLFSMYLIILNLIKNIINMAVNLNLKEL